MFLTDSDFPWAIKENVGKKFELNKELWRERPLQPEDKKYAAAGN